MFNETVLILEKLGFTPFEFKNSLAADIDSCDVDLEDLLGENAEEEEKDALLHVLEGNSHTFEVAGEYREGEDGDGWNTPQSAGYVEGVVLILCLNHDPEKTYYFAAPYYNASKFSECFACPL